MSSSADSGPPDTGGHPSPFASRLNALARRIEIIQEALGYDSVEEMAAAAGMAPSTIYRWMSEDRTPSSSSLDKFAAAFGVNRHYVLKGKGDPFEPGRAPSSHAIAYTLLPEGHGAGPARVLYEGEGLTVVMPREAVLRRFGRVPDPARTYITYVRGESMEPFLPVGTEVWIEQTEERTDGRYAIELEGEGATIKRLAVLGGGRIDVISDAPGYPSISLKHCEGDVYESDHGHVRLRIVGRVIWPRDTEHAMLRMMRQQVGYMTRDLALAIHDAVHPGRLGSGPK